MKKLFFSLVAALCCSASMYADDLPEELVATLNHNGTLTAYYSANAFIEAMENAENGDEITLTGGTFNSPSDTCRKAVTIRGAGIKEVVENKTYATTINGALKFRLPIDTNKKLSIEGVILNSVEVNCTEMKEAVISKSNISYLRCYGGLLNVINCYVGNFFSRVNGYAYIKNSVVKEISTSADFHCTYEHCLMLSSADNQNGSGLAHSVFRHCIIDRAYSYPYTTQIFNCILSDGGNRYDKAQMESCYIVNGKKGDWWYPSSFLEYLLGEGYNNYSHLTDEAKALYPSTDGTEIGIYGGDYPYTDDITLPFVTKLVIGDRTANGKLPVTIEVK